MNDRRDWNGKSLAGMALLALLAWPASFAAGQDTAAEAAPPAGEHPLQPALDYARRVHSYIEREIRDYECLLIKRERVQGKLQEYSHIEAKIRHEQREGDQVVTPFSFYLKYLGPTEVKGREVLYVAGQNAGNFIGTRGGNRLADFTLSLDPAGRRAMEESRYPVTQIGMKNLVRLLIEILEEELAYDEVDVKFFKNARLNGRSCTHIRVIHPHRREHFRYHLARVLIDDELKLPIYFAAYDWPREEGGPPILLEEYAYTDVKLNVGLTDEVFDRENPAYGFRKPEPRVSSAQ